MNPDNTVEYNSLSWVKTQLDDVLSDAQSNLNEYIENNTDEHLEHCIEHLQLIYGTLQMVEVYGAAMLSEEMQKTSVALLQGNVERVEDAYDVLMRAMLQLPDYLEKIQAGHKDAPISLMPLINDLRAARNEGLLTESVLFSPELENVSLETSGYDAEDIEPGKLQGEVKRLRTHYQLGLLDFIRNNKERAGLQRIKAVLSSLEKVSCNAEVRRLWMVIGALVEGLIKQGIDTNLSIKMLLAAVDRQLKLVLNVGEEKFSESYSRELVTNVLYYVGLCTVESRAITAVKEAYQLADLIHHESDDSDNAIGGLNADLFDTVSVGITEDLNKVKDVLELFMHSEEQNLDDLVPVTEQLGRIADTYGMLGMGAVRQSIMEQRDVLDSIVKSDAELSERVVLNVASELLKAESELKDYIASRSGFIDMNRDNEDQAVPAAEYRQVVFTVVSEALKNFSIAKEAILAHVSGIGDKEQLDVILQRLEEVRGVSLMLPLGRVETLIVRLQNYVHDALLKNNHKPDVAEQDTVADVVTSIEYFFEALSEGRPGVEQGLNAGDEAADKLEKITQSYNDGEALSIAENLDEIVASGDEPEPEVEAVEIVSGEEADEIASIDEPVSETVKDAAMVGTTAENTVAGVAQSQKVEQYAILADDADEEIVEIFIEEAIEVLGELHTYLPQWKANHDDEEALAVVRRSFHTLKGSGRLLGAELIGEFSWKFENMLNRVIDKKIIVSEDLLHVIDESLNVLPQLIEQLKGNREPIENIMQLMVSADAVSDGRELVFEAETVEDKAVAVNDADITETADVDEGGDTDEATDRDAAEEDVITIELDDAGSDESDDEININIDGLGESSDLEDVTEDFSIDIESVDTNVIELDAQRTGDVEFDAVTEAAEDEIILDTVVITEDDVIIDEDESDEVNVEDVVISVTEEDEISVQVDNEEELIDLSDDVDVNDEYVVDIEEMEIEEIDTAVTSSGDVLDIDPMLLKIYYDESKSHADSIRQMIENSKAGGNALKADKALMRAFHTLYGSARTAEVEAISDLSGPAEKYIKARQDSGEDNIPDAVTTIISEVEQSISQMLVLVSDGKSPVSDKKLQEKINKVVQQEIQAQLQKSWQTNATIEDAGEADLAVENEVVDSVADLPGDDEDVIVIDETAAPESVPEESVKVSYGDIDDELIDIFLEEAEELLENCEETLIEIKATPNSAEHIHQLQRNMHTLKGGARMADLTPIGDLTHVLESLVVMVAENKIDADKALFNLLHESLDALTSILASVKQRQPLSAVSDLIGRIEMLMRGEIAEKRSVERFDVDLSELESTDDDDEIDDIGFAELLPGHEDSVSAEPADTVEPVTVEPGTVQQKDVVIASISADATIDKAAEDKEQPHWGERASDVNFKDSHEQVRVRSDLLNNLVNAAGEVNIYHARMGKQVSDFGFNLSELTQTVVRLKEQLRKLEIETEIQIRSGYEKESDSFDDSFDPLEMDQYSTLQQLTRSLSETAGDVESINEILADITRDSETLLVQESRVSTDLQEGLMRTRMVRFGGLTSRLRRIVRQISRELSKEVEVEIVGEQSEVDRTVLDRIIAPLEHMIRNAVAHGIEMPEARRALGKNETGRILIEVDRQGTNIIINVTDDGAGIDVGKIRQKAIEQGLVTADSSLSDHDALQFILHSGLSTAEEVTQVSGRGVGMDVVDSEIKQLGGMLRIDSVRGKGTEFNIRLPLTLAINQALLVSVSDDVFAVPLASIEGVVRITGLELQRFYDSGNSHYEFNGIEYELRHLGGLLTGNQQDYSKQLRLFPVLLVHVGDQHFALHVDDLIGRREIVVKPVGMQIGAVRGIAGATILADGRVVLILEMSALVIAESLFKPHTPIEVVAEPVVEEYKKTIMVVDDSITIRKVTERMLLRYGIEVVLAKDGVDATNLLQDHIPDLMLLDIEMPRMDGFEVASYIRNDERLKNIPIIMITSRTGSKHKEKAMQIGVNRYLGKPFQEDDLVSNINEILNTAY